MDAIAAEFGDAECLYDVLEVKKTATQAEIKKAYFKIALKCHPDKCPGDLSAKNRFQALSLVHSVLSDSERRNLYDESGEVEEAGQDERTEDGDLWCDYWRILFPKITEAEISSFGNKYKGSDEEKQDVLEAYKKCKGKLSDVVDSIMLATDGDEDRFRVMIDHSIQQDEISAYPAYRAGGKNRKSASKRKAKLDKEAIEAEKLVALIKERNDNGKRGTSLSSHRTSQFDTMVSSLEGRYGGGKATSGSRKKGGKESKRSKKNSPLDLDDAEFERIQQKLVAKR